MSDRRTFLRGLVSLPLIGGGVTLIGRPAQAIPLVQAAALPTLDDPRQRARYAWEAFSAAMREITTDTHGWHVQGGEAVPYGTMMGGAYLMTRSRTYASNTDPRFPRLVVEQHVEFDL